MREKTDRAFVEQWAVDHGWTIEAGIVKSRPPGIVMLCKGENTIVHRGETLEFAFKWMASALKGEDPFC